MNGWNTSSDTLVTLLKPLLEPAPMMTRLFPLTTTFLALLCATYAPAQVTTEATTQSDNFSPEVAEATFNAVWNAMQQSGALASMSEVDWATMRAEYEPAALDATSNDALRAALNRMIESLGKSHFAIIPGEAIMEFDVEDVAIGDMPTEDATEEGTEEATDSLAPDSDKEAEPSDAPKKSTQPGDGQSGIHARFVDKTARVVAVTPGSPAAQLGIQPGWEIASIRGRSLHEYAEQFGEIESSSLTGYHRNAALQAMLTAEPDTVIPIHFIDLDGEEKELHVPATPQTAQVVTFGNLPPMPVTTQSQILTQADLAKMNIEVDPGISAGLVAFDVWMVPIVQPFAQAIETFRDAQVDCIIVDVRGNPGGLGGLAMGVAGHFTDEPVNLGTMTNAFGEMHFNTNPQRVSASGKLVEPLDVPLFILVDEMSASTSEIFAGGLQTAERAIIVGRKTPGLALPAIASDLPNGDIFYHAIAAFELANGDQIEGVGIAPDVPVQLNPDAFRTSSDPDLHAALEWLHNQDQPNASDETLN